MSGSTRGGLQSIMKVCNATARLETVTMDVLEIIPKSNTGMKKVLVVGDVFTRFNLERYLQGMFSEEILEGYLIDELQF